MRADLTGYSPTSGGVDPPPPPKVVTTQRDRLDPAIDRANGQTDEATRAVATPFPAARCADELPAARDWPTELATLVVAEPWQYERRLFDLARYIKLDLGLTRPPDYRPIFELWWALSRPHCPIQDEAQAWCDLNHGIERAHTPLRRAFSAESIWSQMKHTPVPREITARYQGLRAKLAQLAQRMGALRPQPFALSSHQVARMLNINHGQAYRVLRSLCEDDPAWLRCDDRGRPGPGGSGAARYTWIGPPLKGAAPSPESARRA